MSRILGRSRKAVSALCVVLVFASVVFGQGPVEESETDYRHRVMLAYGLVMGAVVFYLVLSHFRNARLADEIEFLTRRVEELQEKEKTGSAPPPP